MDISNYNKYPIMFSQGYEISKGLRRGYYASTLVNNELQKADTLFNIGLGHNEFQSISLGKGDDGSLLLLNYPYSADKLMHLTKISRADSISTIKNVNNWKKYDLTNLPAIRYTGEQFVEISDSTILIIGAPFDAIGHLFSFLDYRNSKITPLDYWPNDGIECDSFPKHGVYADYSMLFKNNNDSFLYVCGRERFAFIFTINSNKIKIIKELYTVYSDYKSDKYKLNYVTKSRHAEELRCCTNSSYIYTLLVECDKEGNKLDKWTSQLYGNIVEVFDWNGQKQKVIHLDKYGQRIFVSDDNKKLYLLTDDYDEDEPKIWVYEISK